jgi:hypothetical protein
MSHTDWFARTYQSNFSYRLVVVEVAGLSWSSSGFRFTRSSDDAISLWCVEVEVPCQLNATRIIKLGGKKTS